MNKRGTEKKKNRKKEGEKARAMVRERLRESGQCLERSQDAFREIRAVTRERGSRNDSIKKKKNEGESEHNMGKEGEAKEKKEDKGGEYTGYTGKGQK